MTATKKPNLERLANDMVSFLEDSDPYEFRDGYGIDVEGHEAAYNDAMDTILTRSRLKTAIDYLEEEPIDYDDDLERRRRSLVRRMRTLLEVQPPAVRNIKTKGRGSRR